MVRAGWFTACAASVALGVTVGGPAPAQALLASTGVLLSTAALVDVHEFRLPNQLLAAAFATALAAAAVDRLLVAAVVGTLLAGGLMVVVRLARGVGMGDVKMAGVVGAAVAGRGLAAAPTALAVAAATGAFAGAVLGTKRLALGPALWLGWAAALVLPVEGWMS